MEFKDLKRRILFDFHMPDFLDEVKVDVEKYVSDLVEMGTQLVVFMTKSAYGNCYYDSKVGYKNKSLKQDLLKEIIPLLRKNKIKIIAYYNVSLNDIEAKKHPDWQAIDMNGEKVRFEYYDQLCLNSPLIEIVEKQIREIGENYDIDGIWLDLTYMAYFGCFCHWCKELFKQKYGITLTSEIKKDPMKNKLLQEFMRESRFRFIKKIHDVVKSIKPSLLIGWNHAGNFYFNEVEIDEYADFSSVEFHPPFYDEGSIRTKYLRNLGKPFGLIIPETLSGWGDWTVMPLLTMELMATISVMNGGSITIGNVVYPSEEFGGKMAKSVKETIKKTFSWIKKISPYCLNTETVPVNAVFYSAENSRIVNSSYLTEFDFNQNSLNTLFGMGKILLYGNLHFDILSEKNIKDTSLYEVLLLPDIRFINSDIQKEIIRYVENGGKLIATYLTGFWNKDGEFIPDSPFSKLFGIKFEKFSSYSSCYVYDFDKKIAQKLPDMPLLINDSPHDKPSFRKSLYVLPTTSKPLAYFVEPVVEPDHVNYIHVYHKYSPPARRTKYPAIVYNRYGKGKVIYIAFPLCSAYSFSKSPWLKQILLNCISFINPNSKLEIKAPSTIEVNLMKRGNIWFLHLLNTQLSRDLLYQQEEIPSGEIECNILKPEVKKVISVLSGKPIKFNRVKNGIKFCITEIKKYELIKIE